MLCSSWEPASPEHPKEAGGNPEGCARVMLWEVGVHPFAWLGWKRVLGIWSRVVAWQPQLQSSGVGATL